MGAVETVKLIARLVKDLGRTELYAKILDLQSEVMDLTEDRRQLRRELADLKERQQVRESLVFHGNGYWLPQVEGYEGPYCSVCFDTDGKLVRGHYGYSYGPGGKKYCCCRICNSEMGDQPPRKSTAG